MQSGETSSSMKTERLFISVFFRNTGTRVHKRWMILAAVVLLEPAASRIALLFIHGLLLQYRDPKQK